MAKMVALLLVGSAFALGGCGAPSTNDLCNARCDAVRRCGYANDTATANCHTDCNNMRGTQSDMDTQLQRDCQNAGQIRSDQLACVNNTSCGANEIAYGITVGACVLNAQSNCVRP